MRLCDAATMRAHDQYAIDVVGIPGVVLMENAGRGAAALLLERWSDEMKGGVTVLCGRGNNGGDGFVIARHLHNAGYPVRIFLFAARSDIQGDAAINLAIADKMGLPITEVLQESLWTDVQHDALKSVVVVDAIFGTGLRSEIRGLPRAVIESVNGLERRVLAVDIPSGLHASTGRPQGVAMRADLTATFGQAKLGLVLEPALPYVGELYVIEITIPRERLLEGPDHDRLLEASDVARMLPGRPFDGHKGTFGHLAVVAGSVGKLGAAVLACHAALRSGVGLVTLAIPRSAWGVLPGLGPEVMVEPIEDEGRGHFVPTSLAALERLLENKDAIAIGPGLSTVAGVGEVIETLVRTNPLPKVIDADGLNVLVDRQDAFREAAAPTILTPHPGEASRLLGLPTRDVQSDRVSAARALAGNTGATVVLKGARTLVATPDGRLSVNPTGNSGLGTGGTGDVLTGLVGGLLAQRTPPGDAAAAGVYLHGLAGDLAAAQLGGRAMIAGDVIACLGGAFRQVAGREA